MTLAKALKCKNRLAEKIRKIDGDIQAFNSVASEADNVINVRELYNLRKIIVSKLIEIKTLIMNANSPIWGLIFELAETKAEIQFLALVPTRQGKDFVASYRATEVLEYKAEFQKPEIDALITTLEKRVDEIQEQIDKYNYSTIINFTMP